jgi:hypothetical protein
LLKLVLHVTEACIWGVVLNKIGPNLPDSIYFSANTYRTIGYGKLLLPEDWRELSPIMAISGLFTFMWTTGEMFNVIHSQHELVAELSGPALEAQGASSKQASVRFVLQPAVAIFLGIRV